MRRAFTLIDLSISIAIIAIAVVVVIPTASPTERLQLIGATNTLIADIEFAQAETLANPSDPSVLRFDFDNDTYWVALASTPDTPINHPVTGEPYIRELNANTSTTLNITLPSGGDTITFNDFGSLDTMSDAVAHIASEMDETWVVVNFETGFAAAVSTEPEIEEARERDPDPEPDPDPDPDPDPEPEDEGGGGLKVGGGKGGISLGR